MLIASMGALLPIDLFCYNSARHPGFSLQANDQIDSPFSFCRRKLRICGDSPAKKRAQRGAIPSHPWLRPVGGGRPFLLAREVGRMVAARGTRGRRRRGPNCLPGGKGGRGPDLRSRNCRSVTLLFTHLRFSYIATEVTGLCDVPNEYLGRKIYEIREWP